MYQPNLNWKSFKITFEAPWQKLLTLLCFYREVKSYRFELVIIFQKYSNINTYIDSKYIEKDSISIHEVWKKLGIRERSHMTSARFWQISPLPAFARPPISKWHKFFKEPPQQSIVHKFRSFLIRVIWGVCFMWRYNSTHLNVKLIRDCSDILACY